MCFTTIKQLKLTELFSNKSSSPDPAQKDYHDVLWQLSSVRLHCDKFGGQCGARSNKTEH